MAERGRPRAFDAQAALDRAIDIFWQKGYEGASLRDLTDAMGINRPSLYACYGNKEQLFRAAMARYVEVEMVYVREALEQPTAFEVAAALLRATVVAVTRGDHPAGCLSVQGGTACGADDGVVSGFLAASRLAGERALAERLARATADGDIPDDTDPAALARFVMVVAEGLAVHAAAGVSRAELAESAELALRVLVPARRPAGAGA